MERVVVVNILSVIMLGHGNSIVLTVHVGTACEVFRRPDCLLQYFDTATLDGQVQLSRRSADRNTLIWYHPGRRFEGTPICVLNIEVDSGVMGAGTLRVRLMQTGLGFLPRAPCRPSVDLWSRWAARTKQSAS